MIFDTNSSIAVSTVEVNKYSKTSPQTNPSDANIRCFEDINMLDRGYSIDETQILNVLKFINKQNEYSDGSMLCILKTISQYSYVLSSETLAKIKETILNFKYRMDEPGCEDIRYWPESRRLSFAAAEYIAGRLYPDDIFRRSKMSGHRHMKKGEQILRKWFKQRFLYGFSQWHSPEAYERNIAALTLIIDCAGENEITRSAEIILDLQFFEIALNCFNGRFVAVTGASDQNRKESPSLCGLNDILRYAFEFDVLGEYDYRRLSSVFILRKKYELPQIIVDIAQSRGSYIIKESMGLDVSEIKNEFPNLKDIDDTGMFLWGMGSFTNAQSIEISLKMLNKFKLHSNKYLKILKPFNNPLVRGLRLHTRLARVKPPLPAKALSRANIYTFKTDRYMLSTAQKYLPGEQGPNRHIWQASLPNDINVFAACPMPEGTTGSQMCNSPMCDSSLCPDGIVINPHACQFESVVISVYKVDTKFKQTAAISSYLHFPFERFDDFHMDVDFVCGVIGNSFIGVKGITDFERISDTRIIQPGRITAYAVMLADTVEFGSLESFITFIRKCDLSFQNNKLVFYTPNWHYELYELEYGGNFYVTGQRVETEYARLETPFSYASRKPNEVNISFNSAGLRLNLEKNERQLS